MRPEGLRSDKDRERFAAAYVEGKPDECWPWMKSRSKLGYGRFWLRGRIHIAPRVAYALAHGLDEVNGVVCHTCDNAPCVNPAHLFLGTMADNMHDMMRKGRHRTGRGARHACARLTEDQVRAIRATTLSERKAAEVYGVSPGHIGRIRRRQLWRSLDALMGGSPK